MPTPTLDAPTTHPDELRAQVAAKRELTRMKRWKHRAVNTPLNGVGLHHLMALSDRDWRRWPRVGGGGHREGLDNSGVMVFTAEDFDSDAVEGDDGEDECDGGNNSSGIYYGSSSTSSSSDSDGELSEDWEDPLWVKDDNVRTEGRCDWTPPRPLQVVRQVEPDDDDSEHAPAAVIGVKTAKKNESDRKTKGEGRDRMSSGEVEVEHLVSSNELSWIIDSHGRQSSEEVVMELEEQDAEEEDHRARARGGTESSYERGAEYLLQKYFCSLPTFPTRAGSRISVVQQVIDAQQRQRAETTTTTTTTTTSSKNEAEEKKETTKPTSKKEKKTKSTKKEKNRAETDSGKKVMVPRIEGLSLDEASNGDVDKEEGVGSAKRRQKRSNSSQEKTSSCPTPRTVPSSVATPDSTPREAGAAAKGTKGGPGRNLVNFFNLSPRRPRDLTKRRSSFIRRRSIEEEAEAAAAAHEAALRHLQQLPQQPHPEEVDGEADEGEEWAQGLKKPRRKRSISIPLSSYRLELEFMSLKSALSKGDSGGGNGESGGGGKAARRLRRKGPAEGSSKKTRKGHNKFNTITSMTDTRQYYFMDEFKECGAKKAER
jgi:hypothetical protein